MAPKVVTTVGLQSLTAAATVSLPVQTQPCCIQAQGAAHGTQAVYAIFGLNAGIKNEKGA